MFNECQSHTMYSPIHWKTNVLYCNAPVSYCIDCIVSYRIASHRIASHRIASHRIASHRIVRIVSYRNVSYRNVSYRITRKSTPHCLHCIRACECIPYFIRLTGCKSLMCVDLIQHSLANKQQLHLSFLKTDLRRQELLSTGLLLPGLVLGAISKVAPFIGLVYLAVLVGLLTCICSIIIWNL